MYLRESQNVVASRAVAQAARELPVLARQDSAAAKTPPTAVSQGNILRAGMQLIDEAVLGQ